ncbi:MAG: hypothetical protein KGH54_00985 [Candidatus Micrarchaeota archaeon]|nr:hypothetical protein [Candidatus Micrarchaeota archaeon]
MGKRKTKSSPNLDEKPEPKVYFYSNDNQDCIKAQNALVLSGIEFEKIKALKRNIHVPALVDERTYRGFPQIKAYAESHRKTFKIELRGLEYNED